MVDHSTNRVVIHQYVSNILLQPVLYNKYSYEQCVYLHEHIVQGISLFDICSSVSLQVTILLFIHHSNTLIALFRVRLLISLLWNRFLSISCSILLHLFLLLNFIQFSMIHSQSLFSPQIHFLCLRLFFIYSFILSAFQHICLKIYVSGISKKKLSHEFTDCMVESFIYHLLSQILSQKSLSKQLETGYLSLREEDNLVWVFIFCHDLVHIGTQ